MLIEQQGGLCVSMLTFFIFGFAGAMFLSGGQSELEATLNLNAMNQAENPWHVSFSYARALQNSCLKTWQGEHASIALSFLPYVSRSPSCSALDCTSLMRLVSKCLVSFLALVADARCMSCCR
jgi:Fructose-bisphosphate aldolase class-I